MSTTIRSEVSKKNEYYISKYRYLELKNFCFQYDTWKKAYNSLDDFQNRSTDVNSYISGADYDSKVEKIAINKAALRTKMEMVEQAAMEADPEIYQFLLDGVTKNIGYVGLKMVSDIPCSKDYYYERYRKFFWILSKKRD